MIWVIFVSIGLMVPFALRAQDLSPILWACTIGPIDAGIVDLLEDRFEQESGIRVRHVGAGTGAALDLARKGNIDLVMVHAKALEEKFVSDGFGTERIDLMYNDFVIVGPSDDPAGIRGEGRAVDALRKISEKRALFVTRGDRSGTHVAEMELWAKAGITPLGSWYVVYENGFEGNVSTLRYADRRGAYTVMDRATFLSIKNEVSLMVLVEKDEALLNYISVIPVDPKRVKGVNHKGAIVFIEWLVSPDGGQKIIRDFGKNKFGSPLFFPNSKQWREHR